MEVYRLKRMENTVQDNVICARTVGRLSTMWPTLPYQVGSRYPHKWLKYFQMMVEGFTSPKFSEAFEIHTSMAFYWRDSTF